MVILAVLAAYRHLVQNFCRHGEFGKIYHRVGKREWKLGTMTAYPLGLFATSRRLVSEGTNGGYKNRIPERLLAKLWKEKAARLTGLRTEAGKRVRVVYAGRSGTSAGPDFLDALLEVEDQGLVRGDVELHIKQRDWDAHGHGEDPHYNGVVLHGVLRVNSEATRLHGGGQAPVVDLGALLEANPAQEPPLDLWEMLARRGFPRPGSMAEAGNTLDRAGDRRFDLQAKWLSDCIRAQGPDQALYEALMEGLGYSSNRRPFIELASRAPYQAVAEAAGRLPPGIQVGAIRSWLEACSGLAAPDSPHRHGPARPKNFGPAMEPREWRLFRVRPANHPRRRIVGAAVILDRFLEPGLACGLGAVVQECSPAGLTEALCAADTFGPACVGSGRAKDLAVNAVLPFMCGWARASGQGPGREAALALYHRFTLLADNELVREMTEQLLPAPWRQVVTTARRQQGLLHLSALLRGAH